MVSLLFHSSYFSFDCFIQVLYLNASCIHTRWEECQIFIVFYRLKHDQVLKKFPKYTFGLLWRRGWGLPDQRWPSPLFTDVQSTAEWHWAGQTWLTLWMTPQLPDTLLLYLKPLRSDICTDWNEPCAVPQQSWGWANYDSTVNDDGGRSREGSSSSRRQTDNSWTLDYSLVQTGLMLQLCFNTNVKYSLLLTFTETIQLGARGEEQSRTETPLN